MKLIATLLIITATLAAAPSTSHATDYRRSSYCAPVLLSTCEVGRCCQSRIGYDHCGRAVRYSVTVVTYRSHFSDGSSRTFSRMYGA